MAEINFDGNIAIRLIENAVLVRCGVGWLSFPEWDGVKGAAQYVAHRIEQLKKERAAAPR